MAQTTTNPAHLDPSELGTKEYWDNYYQNDLNQNTTGDDDEIDVPDPADLESWFDDVDAPARVLEYLTSEDFPYSPTNPDCENTTPSVLDLGTGNGSMLFMLRMEGDYTGPMVGVDYSQQSVDLARKLWSQYSSTSAGPDESMKFEKVDLLRDDPKAELWFPEGGFDLVLDKGTFDAISLSSETVDGAGGQRRICELYPGKVVDMVAVNGYLLVTSCNWTEEELKQWFLQNGDVAGRLKLWSRIDYPVYEFGGQRGSGVASLCFQRVG